MIWKVQIRYDTNDYELSTKKLGLFGLDSR